MADTAVDIMLTDFDFVDCDVTVAEAEAILDEGNLDALPVLNPDRTVFGLLTSRNLAHFHRRPLNNPRAFHVWEICDARPLIAATTTPIDAITESLLDGNGRQVLIVNNEQQLVGLISTERLLQAGALPARVQSGDRQPGQASRVPSDRLP